jgi:hypothetical protein
MLSTEQLSAAFLGVRRNNMTIAHQLPAGCVLKGYLVTHADGFEARLGPDRARAEAYLRQHRGTQIEPLFVFRAATCGSGGC